MKNFGLLFCLLIEVLLFDISCSGDKQENDNKQADSTQFSHHILFFDNKGDAFLTLDSTFNDNYFYNSADCIPYFDHCIKPKNLPFLQRGFFWSNLSDSLHYLLLSYEPYSHDSLDIQKLIVMKKEHEYYKKSSRFIFNDQSDPFLVTKKIETYLTEDGKEVTFLQLSAKGKINITLITNRIPNELVDSYFDNILKKTIINFKYSNYNTDSLEKKINYTDSINRAINK